MNGIYLGGDTKIELMMHMVGLDDYPKIHKIDGYKLYVAYRNYYGATSTGNKVLDNVSDKLITRVQETPSSGVEYRLTPTGMAWLGHELGILITYNWTMPEHIGTEALKVDTITTTITLPNMILDMDQMRAVITRELAVRFGSAVVEHGAFRLISVTSALNGIDLDYNYEIRLVRYPEEEGGGVVMP